MAENYSYKNKKIESYNDLDVYQRSYKMSIFVCNQILPKLPAFEKFDLTDQLRRSSRAVPRLIAEGFAKKHQKKGFRKYLDDAMAETNESCVGLCQIRDMYSNLINLDFCGKVIEQYKIIGKQLFRLREAWKKFSRMAAFSSMPSRSAGISVNIQILSRAPFST